jgi:hypothetical protein
MSIAEQLLTSSETIFLGMYPNGWSNCKDCKADIDEVDQVGERRQALVKSLGEYCHRAPNGQGDLYVPSYKVEEAANQPGALEAAEEYDRAVDALKSNRRMCRGAEGFTRDGAPYVYCPRLDQEFPVQQ